ncbi:MAG: APC family permease [Ignavibacteriae bacterium]|nr:APC family permease [Ignavibacteriota bacterium]
MPIIKALKKIFIGKEKNPNDPKIFHKIALIAFFAWVGLGSDGLSSSCYGPSEVMMALKNHPHLSILIAFGTMITIFVISSSYSQIIELFPSGGGGYLVASKLLTPHLGMISGCALLIDYVLTITVSIASGADAFFSFLPAEFLNLKIYFALTIVSILTWVNMRGVKESVTSLVPIFLVFIVTHVFIILYAIFTHYFNFSNVAAETANEISHTYYTLGIWGTLFILIHAYSMGAGTFTGIEAVSNGVGILKEPRVQTGKKTMLYMAVSLSFMVIGLVLAFVLFDVGHQPGKTINAVLFEKATSNWNPSISYTFVIITLISESALLFVAAQTGFIGGPGVLSNMALDRWMPTRFASLSDRLVIQKGILVMGIFSFVLMIFSSGSVTFLVVLYSINVFLTFVLSQLGMVRHWWIERHKEKKWFKKLMINGLGLILSLFILISVTVVKFNEGGWITIFITGMLVLFSLIIKRDYDKTGKELTRLNKLLEKSIFSEIRNLQDVEQKPEYNKFGKTAVLLVNGFTGLGVHSLLNIIKLFSNTFKNYIFVEVGVIDAGVFKGVKDIEQLKSKIDYDVEQFSDLMLKHGYFSEGFTSTGLDVVEEVKKLVPQIRERYPNSVFFGGQIVFPKENLLTRFLHNYTVFSVQRELYSEGIQFVILPIKLQG